MAITIADLKEQVRRAFKEEFPDDTVDVSEDEHGHLQVVIVSNFAPRFSTLSPFPL